MDAIITKGMSLEAIEQVIEHVIRDAWYKAGLHFYDIKINSKFRERGEWLTWEDYCSTRWGKSARNIDRVINSALLVAEIPRILLDNAIVLPYAESHAIELAKLSDPEHRAEVWRRVIENTNGTGITARMVQAEVERYKAELERNWITVEEWAALDDRDKMHALSTQGDRKFNETNENIEWAAFSWNPVTGCLHGCDYCYARDIAARFYPQKFVPSFYPSRLSAPANTKVMGQRWNEDIGNNGVFVCSMADLFGKWVPEEWITAVLGQVQANPQWNFLFLTKFPIRMAEFEYPPNVWLGASVDRQFSVDRAEKAFWKIKDSGFDGVCWLSCEPMLERLTFTSLDMFDWVVMGGASKSTQTDEYHPPFDDVVHLHNQARSAGCDIYHKTNLLERLREYPTT